MIAILIVLVVSWLLLKYLINEDLSLLGFYLKKKNMLLFLSGFFLPLIYLSALYYFISLWVQNPYKLNPGYNLSFFIISTVYVFKSVVLEELIFRGAPLFILARKINPNMAIAISVITFGIYHWFSFHVFGQPLRMLTVFLSTGFFGYILASAVLHRKTLWLPLGLHFGNNFTGMVLFSKERNIGSQLLIKTFPVDPFRPEGILPLAMLIMYYIGFPILCLVYLRVFIRPKRD